MTANPQTNQPELTGEDVRGILLDTLGALPECLSLFAELYLIERLEESLKDEICDKIEDQFKHGLNRILNEKVGGGKL